ncbi:MAG TPA: DUF1015 domain-containing protein [Vitreimonas sp.]|nr:DUF1015 domain-containing protein [Vitreimonas sp.]
MPTVRPFRALRYRSESVPDLSRVVSPPYDVISAEEQRVLLERDPRNVVRLDLPTSEVGEEPDDRYRRAARTLAAWRSDGTLHKDPRPALYPYEQVYVVPGTGESRTQRGFFGRLRLESLEPGSGVRPHERTLAGPREDRYRLLRATGVNTSAVVVLHEDPSGATASVLDAATAGRPAGDVVDDEGVRHRLWVLPDDGDAGAPVARLTELAGQGAVTIADGHHRYETALRYRDERRMSRSCEEDPAFDYILALFLESRVQPLTVLPTHRLVHGVDPDALVVAAREHFAVEGAEREVLDRWGVAGHGGRGCFGLWTRSGGYTLTVPSATVDAWLPAETDAVRSLDVTVLGAVLEHLAGIDAEAVAGGGRMSYTKSATDAMRRVDERVDGADAAFLLEPTPVASILAVAGEGNVMPQKSTYFHPKPLTGLVINPHEW